jgi:hypothetical protein
LLIVESCAIGSIYFGFAKANTHIYNFAMPYTIAFLAIYSAKLLRHNTLKYIIIFGALVLLLLYIRSLYQTPFYQFKDKIFLWLCWFITISALFYFIELILYPNEEDLLKSPPFYFFSGLLLLNIFLIIYISLYPQLISTLSKINLGVKFLKTTISLTSYSVILYGFVCLHKKTT